MENPKPPNPVGIQGIEFIEFASPTTESLVTLFESLGLHKCKQHHKKNISLYTQNDVHWLVNAESNSFAAAFSKRHGPSIPSMGWRVESAKRALEVAVARGARLCDQGDYATTDGRLVPAIYGIGDSIIYFIEHFEVLHCYAEMGFTLDVPANHPSSEKGFLLVDHLTNNVPNGSMEEWSNFYKSIFGFTEVRTFDIRGQKTGLKSYALRSPCESFCIPINEAKEEKSQINEYLREYHGAGIQHVALLTRDIISSLRALQNSNVKMLDVDPSYYRTVFDRVPNVTEDKRVIEELGILVDGDAEGYLLQIFTQNLIGPIFFEIIQRKNHLSFGEGNFGALFRSIERDQEKRGVL